MTPLEQSQKVLYRIIKRFPKLRWAWVMTADGLPVSAIGGLHYDISKILENGEVGNIEDIKSDIYVGEESRIDPMSTAAFSIAERIAKELRMGEGKFSIIAGTDTILIIMPIGSAYYLSIGIKATASFADVIQYFDESNELSELETIWNLR